MKTGNTNAPLGDGGIKFNEYLQLKKYSRATIATTIKTVEYFRAWAESENMEDLAETSYSDAMSFVKWSSRHGASQKTVANYLSHVRKYFNLLYPGYPASTTKLILTESIIDAASLLQQRETAEHYTILSLYRTNGLTEEHLKAMPEEAAFQIENIWKEREKRRIN